jgi:hypothetical protein
MASNKDKIQKAQAEYDREKKVLGYASSGAYQHLVIAYLAAIEEHLDNILKKKS